MLTRLLLDKYDEDKITIQSEDSSEEDNHQVLDIKDKLAGYKCSTLKERKENRNKNKFAKII